MQGDCCQGLGETLAFLKCRMISLCFVEGIGRDYLIAGKSAAFVRDVVAASSILVPFSGRPVDSHSSLFC